MVSSFSDLAEVFGGGGGDLQYTFRVILFCGSNLLLHRLFINYALTLL